MLKVSSFYAILEESAPEPLSIAAMTNTEYGDLLTILTICVVELKNPAPDLLWKVRKHHLIRLALALWL
jgi:hypothetical protein